MATAVLHVTTGVMSKKPSLKKSQKNKWIFTATIFMAGHSKRTTAERTKHNHSDDSSCLLVSFPIGRNIMTLTCSLD
jgi:hypothetical protein